MSRHRRSTVDIEIEHRADQTVERAGAAVAVQFRPALGDVPTTDEPIRTRNAWERTFGLRRITADVVVFGLIALLAFAIWPVRLGGATSYIIVEGTSMEPRFHTGDLAVLRAQDTYRKGDIVAYRIPNGSAGGDHLVIHRIIGRSHGGFLMQGENRTTPDSWYPKANDILGRFRLLVPLPGIQFWALVPWFCCAAIGVGIGWILWPRPADQEPSDDTNPSATTGANPAHAASNATTPVAMGERRRRRIERQRGLADARRDRSNRRRRHEVHSVATGLSIIAAVVAALATVA